MMTSSLGALNSLVIGAKSRTAHNDGADGGAIVHPEHGLNVTAPGTRAVLYRREWSDEWRVRCEQDTPHGRPPEQSGDRITTRLTNRGALKIADSCEYLLSQGRGFTTFATITLNEEARRDIQTIERKAELVRGGGCNKITWLPTPHCVRPEWAVYVGGELASGPFCKVEFKWRSSVQQEASRFFNSIKKMWLRGWTSQVTRTGGGTVGGNDVSFVRFEDRRVFTLHPHNENDRPHGWGASGQPLIDPAKTVPLDYVWVVESPKAGPGWTWCPPSQSSQRLPPFAQAPVESVCWDNPHIHLLIRWRVPWRYFGQWAKRLESIWGRGFVKLEKLRSKEAAAYYIAKAVGYLTKGKSGDSQGTVRGNRYGISASARAPGWVQVTSFEWGRLGDAIAETREIVKLKRTPLVEAKEREKQRLADKNLKKHKRQAAYRKYRELLNKAKNMPIVERFGVRLKGAAQADWFLRLANRLGHVARNRPPGMWLSEFRLRRSAIRNMRSLLDFCLYHEQIPCQKTVLVPVNIAGEEYL